MTVHKVTLQDNEYDIQRFKGLKAILAIAALTRVAREVPDVSAKAVRDFQERNKIRVTPELNTVRGYGFTPDEFQSHGGVIELPAGMSGQEQLLAALPDLLERARKPVLSLLAILIVDNGKLREADKEGQDHVEALLDSHYDFLLDTDLEELADLAATGYEVLEEQLSDPRGRLGKLINVILRRLTPKQVGPTTPSTQAEVETKSGSEPTSPTSTDESPNSSIDSGGTTSGPESTPSTMSPGPSLPVSVS